MRGYPTVYLMLSLWVPISVAFFAFMRPQRALLCALLGGILVLPENRGFDVSGLPAIGKLEIASIGALFGAFVFRARELTRNRIGFGLEALFLLAIPFALGTVLTNQDPTGGAFRWFPGLRPYDAASPIFRDLLMLGIPFVLGRAFFRTPAAIRELFVGLLVAALIYSLGALWEARMSPHLNFYTYGFMQHSFAQTYREGGWRPMVFMAHGLALSLFLCVGFLTSIGAYRGRLRALGLPSVAAVPYLAVVLLLCRSFAAIVYGLGVAPILLWGRARLVGLVAVGLTALVITYPLLRAADLFPTGALVELAASVSEDRAKSLEVRFENEDGLIDRASERIWFGWGGFGRSTYSGEMKPLVTDGYWILRMSERGILGLGLFYTFMLVPIFRSWRAIPRCRNRQDAHLLAALALIVAVQAVDTLPNGLFHHLPLLLAGAVHGLATTLPRRAKQPERAVAPAPPEHTPLARPASTTTAGLAKGRRLAGPGEGHR